MISRLPATKPYIAKANAGPTKLCLAVLSAQDANFLWGVISSTGNQGSCVSKIYGDYKHIKKSVKSSVLFAVQDTLLHVDDLALNNSVILHR